MFESIFALQITDRIKKVRQNVLKHPVAVSMLDTKSGKESETRQDYPGYFCAARRITKQIIDGWILGRNQPTLMLRRAFTEAYALDHSAPVIYPEDLIAGQLDMHKLNDQEREELAGMAAEFVRYVPEAKGRQSHIALDFPKLLRVGVNGLLKEIREKRSQLDLNDPETIEGNIERDEFYQACEMELEALLRYAKRYAEKAREMSRTEQSPENAENLRVVADILDRVPAEPARSFREALQSIHFYTFNLFGLYPAGRPDQYLLPFYEHDIAEGSLTIELAQELVDNYCLLFSTYTYSSLATSFMLAGTDSEGKPVGNAVTAHFLRSILHVNRPDPNYAYAVTSDPDPELFSFAVKNVAAGSSHPSFYNDEGIVRELQAQGAAPEDSHLYCNTTCSEITICGKTSAWTTCPYVNCVNILDSVLHNGKEYRTFQDLLNGFKDALFQKTEENRKLFNLYYLDNRRAGSTDAFRVSCLIEGCIEQGKTIWNRGAKYNPLMPSYIGVSNTAEALSTYDILVYRNKEYSQRELTEIVDADYAGHEDLRLRIIRKLPHYGNADANADSYMQRVTDMILEACKGKWNYRGGKIIPGAFPYLMHATSHERKLPSADGRRHGDILANCPGPLNGFDRNGPTAMLFSSSSWCQVKFLGGVTMNMRLPKNLMNEAGISNIESLILGFFARDGKQLQINCIDAEELERAKENPDEYGNLIVRVGGYSDFFTRLNPYLQEDVIQRTKREECN